MRYLAVILKPFIPNFLHYTSSLLSSVNKKLTKMISKKIAYKRF